MSKSMMRVRWAAIGAAIAVTLGAGGLHVSGAVVGSGDRPVLVTIEPCRLLDLRPAPRTVGSRPVPLGPSETLTVDVRGTNGNCTIPNDALGIVANVTVVNPTAAGYLTLFPAGTKRPTASNLNWSKGDAATPNHVTVALSSAGKLSIFNLNGNVDVIVDILGYTVGHRHDDRYFTEAEVDAKVGAVAAAAAEELSARLRGVVVGGNGEGVGSTICSNPSVGIEVHFKNGLGEPTDVRFSFVVPDVAYGQVRASGSLRTGSANVVSIEHPSTGKYCIVLNAPPPNGADEATVVSVNAEQ